MSLDANALAAAIDREPLSETRAVASEAPRLDDAALYGPIGDYVREIAPHTEAHPAAILASALVAVGALLNRGPYLDLDSTHHHARLFVALCGPSAAGRKSTAMNHGATNLLRHVDAHFAKHCVKSGLSTGEGLVHFIRDAVPESVTPGGQKIPADAGVADKRLVCLEDELGGVFKKFERDGNTLSATLRLAWDGRQVQTLARTNKEVSTGSHVCIVGCITPSELVSTLKKGEVLNGLGNRFLFVWTDSVRSLPFGSPPPSLLDPHFHAISRAVTRSREIGRVTFGASARDVYAPLYEELRRPAATGMLASLLARGSTHVCRIALLYAALEGARELTAAHITAALAFWRYCEASTRFIYRSADSMSVRARDLLNALHIAGAVGMSRSDIRAHIGSNVSKDEIESVLAELSTAGLADHLPQKKTGGRPVEMWRHASFRDGDTWASDTTANTEGKEGKEGKPSTIEDSSLPSLSSFLLEPPSGTPAPTECGPGLDAYRWPDDAERAA